MERGQLALYREHAGMSWVDVELIGRHPSGGLVLREVGRRLCGVMLAGLDQVRVPIGKIEQPEIVSRPGLGKRRWGKYRLIRESCGREAALAELGITA